ncbi:ABC transporter permease [Georgenia thermotolerans]|uniref:Transport permease protein n=1 Tax=Georgenia thermotolerans TaxID=527326 RepID=A0A7J5UQ58_9MICO|nr:ABC transporter permease [Georgenia thermotolerans]KAE8764545.1 ABC transporter permease [Georgenia thermotolerans]
MSAGTLPADTFVEPGRGSGLFDVVRQRFLLKLLVRKDLRVRYRGSVLGMLWSYVKPAVQFVVYYFAVGVFLQMNRAVDNFAVYLFAGIVVVNFFGEAFGNATRAIVGNNALVKKIYLPRELFSVSALWVAFIHFIPQLVVLVIGALLTGWSPSLVQLGAGVLGFVILAIFSLGLGLVFGAVNVMFRDAENIVDLLLMVATWASPVLYQWTAVRDVVGDSWVWTVYQLNPLTPIVELFHYCFWAPTNGAQYVGVPNLGMWVGLAALISVLTLVLGEWVFRRLDGRFAQEL